MHVWEGLHSLSGSFVFNTFRHQSRDFLLVGCAYKYILAFWEVCPSSSAYFTILSRLRLSSSSWGRRCLRCGDLNTLSTRLLRIVAGMQDLWCHGSVAKMYNTEWKLSRTRLPRMGVEPAGSGM